jgi:hypothetical protein
MLPLPAPKNRAGREKHKGASLRGKRVAVMRKYPANESVCGAIYDNAPADNPFLAALPEMLPKDKFLSAIRSTPGLPHDLPRMFSEERRQSFPMLASLLSRSTICTRSMTSFTVLSGKPTLLEQPWRKSAKSTLYSAERRIHLMRHRQLPALSLESLELARPPPSGGLWKPCPRLLNTPNTWDSHFTANRSCT